MRRNELIARLRSQSFDVLIIGGGIVGAGIARDAAMRGLRVALIEQGDFAGGTSSKTSKLIHGGLRYLEQGRLRLVAESLRERHILHTIAPQLVWPMTFSIPVYRGDTRAPWKVACGLMLCDLLAMRFGINRHRMMSRRGAMQHEPRLDPEGLRAMGTYVDCQMDDARLCLANVLQAMAFGAVCCNHVKLLEFQKISGRIAAAYVEDRLSHERFAIPASAVVNATGPWSDAIRRLSNPHAGTRLAPTKGI
ncbi:MAG: FAD-dependent oxidoreductase, partial [Candidatus Omnitrophica bacterium]|nr:FAD-dependent oxidoreductase [Candidatus Omnitrophota bacterium]